jgi:small-conductance mechanosensitive channel
MKRTVNALAALLAVCAATAALAQSSASRSVAEQSSAAPASPAATALLPPERVIAHVKDTIDWYHQIQGIEQLPQLADDVVAQDQLQQTALSGVRVAFNFGRAAATSIASAERRGAQASQAGTPLQQSTNRMADRIAELQAEGQRLDMQLARASARDRRTLQAQRSEVSAALDLAREVQGTLNQLNEFQVANLAGAGRSSNSLLGQLQDLERSVPEAGTASAVESGSGSAPTPAASGGTVANKSGAPPAATPGKAPIRQTSFHPEAAGVFALLGDWFALESAQGQVAQALKRTQSLEKGLETLRQPLIEQARALNTGLPEVDATNVAALTAARQQLQDSATRFKQLSSVLVPLGEQQIVLAEASASLGQWRSAIQSRAASVARYLATRAIVLGASIAAVLVLSEIWRRGTFRYLRDSRRRRQFLTLRRIVVALALALVLAFGLVSELGSLATYVGFITAGLAVALQNPILSIVAYFYLIGRYGVQVGDRITLAGVTGRVVEIGLLRIYLLELTGPDLHPAGRIVVLSNAVVFQPQALFKEVPGSAYEWHTIRLTLAASVDVESARQRLRTAADAVFEQYKPALQARHTAVQRMVEYEAALPGPTVQVGYAENGLRFDVSYPVGREESASVDMMMLHAVREAIAQKPELPLAASGEPTLQASGS